jgi:hypothetical protein
MSGAAADDTCRSRSAVHLAPSREAEGDFNEFYTFRNRQEFY